MFWKLFLFTLCIYISVYCMCPEKCVCGRDKISYLQLDPFDQLKLSDDESKNKIQKLILRDSTFKLDKLQKIFPNLQKITLLNSQLITDETERKLSIGIEKETPSLFYSLCMIPILLIAFLQAPHQEICNVIPHMNVVHILVQMCVRIIAGITKTDNFMYKLLTILNRATGKKYHKYTSHKQLLIE